MSNYAIYFSPTGSARKITKMIASEFGDFKKIDLSKPSANETHVFAEDDICIIGVPSFGGRVPAIALERMEGFQGNFAKAVLVCAYGNRAYDDTLVELQDFLTEKYFQPVAAVTAVAEHSIMHQFAKGRPDAEDETQLKEFAAKIKDSLNNSDGLVTDAALAELDLPGNHPYREYNGVPMKPKTSRKCTNCGICAKLCPVQAIPTDNPSNTDSEKCISCMRCIGLCPENARKLDALMVKAAAFKMRKECSGHKPNELFLPSHE